MADLTQPEVSAAASEASAEMLWHEWLAQYFDGGSHVVGGAMLLFPSAVIAFGQASLGQPLDGLGLTVVRETEGERAFLSEGVNESENEEFVQVLFLWRSSVRAPVMSGANAGNAAELCRRGADRLRALLEDPARTIELAKKGIMDVRVVADFAQADAVAQALQVMAVRCRQEYGVGQ